MRDQPFSPEALCYRLVAEIARRSDVSDNKYPIEFEAPDITPYKIGNRGVDYVHTFEAVHPGPHVMVNALTHGNEICGAVALDFLLKHEVHPLKGKLTLCFANVDAHALWDPKNPNGSRFVDEDFNRLWEEHRLDSDEHSTELERARELRPIYEEVDYLLDVHSMGTNHEPLIICNGLEKERTLSRQVGYPAAVVCGPVFAPGKRIIEYTPFHDTSNAKTALLVECGQHWAKYAETAALDTTLCFLKALGVIEAEFADAHITANPPPPQRMMDVTDGVTARTDDFRFVEPFVGFEQFEKKGSVVALDGGREVVTPYDDCILVMPNHRARANQRALRFARMVE